MIVFAILTTLGFSVQSAMASDSELVAQSLLPIMEKTIQNLDRHRRRHDQGGLSAVELSLVTLGEETRFEAAALRIFKENYIDGQRTLAEFDRDPIVRDVRDAFRSYSKKKISLERLTRHLIHERFTVQSFLDDPELGYASFKGFSSVQQ